MFCFAALANLNTGTIYTNLLGAFPLCSFKSMQYIFVAFIYDLNAILVCAMPSKNNAAMITTFTKILAILAACGYKPTLNVTDNKCSKMVEVHSKSNKIMGIHFVPPHNPYVNAAEHATATFKQHFIAGLVTVNRNCSLNCATYFCTKSSSHSTFCVSHAVIAANLPTRRSRVNMNSTKHQSCESELKALPTTNPLSTPAGRRTELIHFTLALPPSTIGICSSTCQPPNNVALLTHGDFTQAIE
jgi:hypothetical protein